MVSGHFSHFDPYLSHLPEDLINKTKSKWPGAHTWLVPANDNVPSWIKGNSDFVALRQSVHPSIIELSEKLNSVITLPLQRIFHQNLQQKMLMKLETYLEMRYLYWKESLAGQINLPQYKT